jgi:hypothetical protein
MSAFVGVHFDLSICHDIHSSFFRSGNYEMEDKENLTAATRFMVPNHGGWEKNGIIMLNK